MTARLPTAVGHVPAVAKENWLPRLAPSWPVAVPPILATGAPGEEQWLGEIEGIDLTPTFVRTKQAGAAHLTTRPPKTEPVAVTVAWTAAAASTRPVPAW